jgi:hypothetical protein
LGTKSDNQQQQQQQEQKDGGLPEFYFKYSTYLYCISKCISKISKRKIWYSMQCKFLHGKIFYFFPVTRQPVADTGDHGRGGPAGSSSSMLAIELADYKSAVAQLRKELQQSQEALAGKESLVEVKNL